MDNSEIAAVFNEMGELLKIAGGDPFRSRAFSRMGDVIGKLPESVPRMLREGSLRGVPGIGEGGIERVKEILRTGTCFEHQRLLRLLPPGLGEMLKIRGLGPRTLRVIYSHLRIGSIPELEAACLRGEVAGLPRVGQTTQERIYQGIQAYKRRTGRVPLSASLRRGEAIAEALRSAPGALEVAVAGSARRGKESMKDLDILVGADDHTAIAQAFHSLPQVEEVLIQGTTRSSVRITGGQQADLRVLPPESFGAGLHYFTGSKHHNIAVRKRALRYGVKVSDHGIFVRDSTDRIAPGNTEEEIFAAVGLPFIPPEIREDIGEIEAAEQGRLPALLEVEDLRGDLHMHTRWSDGSATALEMARAAADLGYDYIAITDHSYSVRGDLPEQVKQLRRAEENGPGIAILAGIEVDIAADGELLLPPDALRGLDWVVASVHNRFDLPPEAQTRRLVRAIESGVVDCIGHPTGRRFSGREPTKVDLDPVVNAAVRCGVALEISGQPDRLDLDSGSARRARDEGALLAINSDAHSPRHLGWHRRLAVLTARRAWVERRHGVNAHPVEQLEARRRDRLRGQGFTVVPRSRPAPERAEAPASLEPVDEPGLAEALAERPLPPELAERVQRFLTEGGDPALERALGGLGPNPLQAAMNLLLGQPQ